MEPLFITTHSKLTIKNGKIWEKRVVESPQNYWYHSFILLLLLIGYSAYSALYEKPLDWLYVLLGLIWISPHLLTIYRFLFVKVWRGYIPLDEIKSIVLDERYNELEEKVTIILKSGRQKVYTFRKAEQQAVPFVESVSSMNSAAFLQTP